MSVPGPESFDPRGVIRLDLRLGQLRLDTSHARVMVPAQALMTLAAAAGETHVVALGNAIGEAIGARVRERFAAFSGGARGLEAVRVSSFSLVVDHIAGELALTGLGALTAERWGKVLVLNVDHCPVANEAIGDVLLCGVLGASIGACCGRGASVIPVSREVSRTRFLVLGDEAVDGVLSALESGVGWTDLIVRLNGAGA